MSGVLIIILVISLLFPTPASGISFDKRNHACHSGSSHFILPTKSRSLNRLLSFPHCDEIVVPRFSRNLRSYQKMVLPPM
jgi:hypothetical protein